MRHFAFDQGYERWAFLVGSLRGGPVTWIEVADEILQGGEVAVDAHLVRKSQVVELACGVRVRWKLWVAERVHK